MKDNKYFEELLKKHCPRYENNRCDRLFVCDFDCQVGKFLKNLFNENVILPINEWINLNKNHAIELNKRADDEYQVGYEKGSNETAKRILNKLFDIFDDKVGELLKIKKSNNNDYNDGRLSYCCECIDEIRDFAILEGVKIEE